MICANIWSLCCDIGIDMASKLHNLAVMAALSVAAADAGAQNLYRYRADNGCLL